MGTNTQGLGLCGQCQSTEWAWWAKIHGVYMAELGPTWEQAEDTQASMT